MGIALDLSTCSAIKPSRSPCAFQDSIGGLERSPAESSCRFRLVSPTVIPLEKRSGARPDRFVADTLNGEDRGFSETHFGDVPVGRIRAGTG